MGCDYYIYKKLQINHENGVSYIELSCLKGYVSDGKPDYDSDEEDFTGTTIDYLQVYCKLILLFENG